jgi:hypothetical protein
MAGLQFSWCVLQCHVRLALNQMYPTHAELRLVRMSLNHCAAPPAPAGFNVTLQQSILKIRVTLFPHMKIEFKYYRLVICDAM